MGIFSTKFEGWCKCFSPIKLASLRKLAPSRNVFCTGTFSIRMAWTLSLKCLSVKPRLLMKRGWFVEVERQLGKSFKVSVKKFIRRRTHSHDLWLLLVIHAKAKVWVFPTSFAVILSAVALPIAVKAEFNFELLCTLPFLPGPSRRLAPVIKCSPFLSIFQRYIVRDISLTWDIAGSLLLGVLADSLKFYPPFWKAWGMEDRKMYSFGGNDTFPSLYDAQVYERKFKSEYLERQF